LSKSDKLILTMRVFLCEQQIQTTRCNGFAQSAMHHNGWVRSLILPDLAKKVMAAAQTVINTLRAAGFNVMDITGAALFKQAEYVWDLALKNASFGRPVRASWRSI